MGGADRANSGPHYHHQELDDYVQSVTEEKKRLESSQSIFHEELGRD